MAAVINREYIYTEGDLSPIRGYAIYILHPSVGEISLLNFILIMYVCTDNPAGARRREHVGPQSGSFYL
jgi:hypothetical protein